MIHSDKGSHFENALMKELLQHMGVVKTHTSGYHPQGNGLVERMNKTIVKCLAESSGDDQKNWPSHLIKVTMSYNMMRQETTDFSPYRLMHGHEANTPLSHIFPDLQRVEPEPASEIVRRHVADMARVAEVVRRNVGTTQIRQARNHDKKITNTPTLQVDEWGNGVRRRRETRQHGKADQKVERPRAGSTSIWAWTGLSLRKWT